ncbi:MCE family protein [Amycolatopsis cihanbeyliensis]|uniref:Phospholipid/cholesterol/gamma-HCH transport system substrate-binding protein n=1 Tax=Amycolatopsis cihanbeyliensis TaxID=1128664 RepID=A0A542DMM1_AMYCI|nr:MCE family protein [Amycolatopsis cihanbeyliensis]TQJ04235.1 phospholipid/cholesterol/gamma-HCH transport system substrate-binding protein [Amycolatopsis cihanbeyliensis]
MRDLVAPLVKLTVFAAVTLLSTGLLAMSIANTDFRSSHAYSARFTDVTSLVEGDDVRVGGVRVGEVERIELIDRRLARVEFSVDAERVLPASVTAGLKYRNMLGQRYIALERGAGELDGTLPPGGEIPLERTSPALDLTLLFNGFRPLFQALSPQDVNKLSYELIQVFQGEGSTVDSLLRHTASLTSTIAGKDEVIGEVIGNLNQVLDTVNARGGELSSLLDTVQRFVSGLAADREPVGAAITSLGDLADSTAGLLADGRPALRSSITELGRLSKNLADNEEIVDAALRNLPVKMESVTRMSSYGSWMNFFLCEATTSPAAANSPLPLAGIPRTEPRCYR